MIEKYLPDNWNNNERAVITYNHSLMVARAAKLIASKCGLDEELAFNYGEMHDIGKFFLSKNEIYKHPRLGYNIILNDNMGIANICITHSFPIINEKHIISFCHNDMEEAELLINILSKIPTNDYIELIQLCDKLSTINKYIKIETKLLWYQEKHHISFSDLQKFYCIPLNNIKEKFSKICNIDIYDLLGIE
ncbi:MAG: HD domain-containing protein [Alphaproteobacteria bacterium]|nr:HD domain-containing protein [Alphaproteobacteria bacterium]